ncbi:MAG: bacterial Ig-like domain-containing protein, partial [Clostridia bacterium]|nr:bacterial Ig-like domain-containing protein [Clostridia bacterium]
VTISNNTAKKSGGGIYSDYTGTIEISNATISNNSADTGGGICSEGTLTANNVTISGNTASREGGGIRVSGTATLENVAILQNTITGNGGGIFINSGTTTIEGGEIKENVATGYGGGIYNDGKTIVDGATISQNTATYNGGGVYNYSELTVSGGIILQNVAEAGGGIYNYGTTTLDSGTKISKNESALSGGGIYNQGTTTVDGGEITENVATDDGGGIYNDNGELAVEGVTISNNSAQYGGGIYNGTDSTVTAENTTVSQNSVTYDGGGIKNNGTLTFASGTISNNVATREGGGIYNSGNSIATVEDTTISDNSAEYGGGIYINSSTIQLKGATISDNSALSGGGIYINSNSTIQLKGTTILQNVATGDGGGIYNNGELTVDGGEIADNTAQLGGGIFNFSKATVSNVSIKNNVANFGADVYNFANDTFEASDSTLQQVNNMGKFTLDGGSVESLFVEHENSTADITGQVSTVYFANIPAQPVVLDGADLQNEIKVVVNVSDLANIEDIVLFENFVCNDDLFVLHKGTIDNAQPVNDFFLMKDSQNKVAVTLVDVAKISVDTQPTKQEYIYDQPFEKDGMVVSATYNNGKTELVDNDDVQIVYQTNENGFYPTDTGVTLQYTNLKNQKITCQLELDINKKSNSISNLSGGWTFGEQPAYNFDADWAEEYDLSFATSQNGVYSATVPTNAGTYWMKIFVHESEFYYSAEQAVEIQIEKAIVSKPDTTKQTVIYNGQKQTADVSATNGIVITNDGGTNAGVYSVIFALESTNNYVWDDDTYDSIAMEFEITKATATIGDASVLGNVRGEDLQINATSNFGDVQYSYAKKGESNFSSEKPTKPGEYVAKITVAGTNNFDGAEKTVEFLIESKLFAGEIVGIVAGSVALSGGIGVGIWFLIKKRKRI